MWRARRIINGDVQAATQRLEHDLQARSQVTLRRATLPELGFGFNDGTNVGVGRISLGAKALIFAGKQLQLAFMPEFFLPSPSESAFAGPASAAILPRLIATARLTDMLGLHGDAGYDYDFDNAPLRRFTWDAGASLALAWASFDAGIGGSEYDAPIRWTPTVIHAQYPAATGRALEDNAVGTSVVDLLFGIKLRVIDTTIIAAGVSVPVINPAFQPDGIGSVAIEHYF